MRPEACCSREPPQVIVQAGTSSPQASRPARCRSRPIATVTAIDAAPVQAPVVYPDSAGKAVAVPVWAAVTRPPSARRTQNPTLRTTWLKLIALEVSSFGVTARFAAGMAAEKIPTPRPRSPIMAKASRNWQRHREDNPMASGWVGPAGSSPHERAARSVEYGPETGMHVGQGGPHHDLVLPRRLLLRPATELGCSAACIPGPRLGDAGRPGRRHHAHDGPASAGA